jgi:molybdopterin/thiamine biosynthesis adenylyltransferase
VDLRRYDRQRRIQNWDQAALLRGRVIAAGAGALGNELIKNLALLGVGRLMVVDFDQVETSNLSRTVLFRETDVGRPKAQVAARAAAQLNPDVDVRYVDGDLFYDLGLGFYRHSDLVIGGLDTLAARSLVGLNCALAGVPFLDGGMWALGGEARWFMAGKGVCFECTLSDSDRARVYERQSCTGFRLRESGLDEPQVATTVSTAAVIGGLLAQEAVRYLCKWEVFDGEATVYNGLTLNMHRATMSRAPECPYHRPYKDVRELERQADEITGIELLRQAEADLGQPAILELGRDFLLGLHCPGCDRYENINAPLGRTEESKVPCPFCGSARKADILSRLDIDNPYSERALSELGVPPGEVLAARAGERLRFYELTGDVTKFWA